MVGYSLAEVNEEKMKMPEGEKVYTALVSTLGKTHVAFLYPLTAML